jgi:formylglycine-generating enzyme required for sulfatase activity
MNKKFSGLFVGLAIVAIIAIQVKVFGQDSVKIEMVFVEGGTFTMGCTPEQKDCNFTSMPAHQVTLNDFYIGKYEITQAQWEAIMESPSHSKNKGANRPMEKINWQDAQKFIRALNRKTGLKYRLPTNAEWEYAARGGNKSKGYRYSGSDNLDEVAWDGKKSETTYDVGTKKPNELGIYDMSGSINEWVSDWYEDYTAEPQNNPKGPETGEHHVLRGGDWINTELHFFCIANRVKFWDIPERLPIIGFRLAHDKIKKSKVIYL